MQRGSIRAGAATLFVVLLAALVAGGASAGDGDHHKSGDDGKQAAGTQPDAATSDYVTAIALAPDIVPETVSRLRQSGYWRSAEMPEEFTNEFRDALQACMLDKRC